MESSWLKERELLGGRAPLPLLLSHWVSARCQEPIRPRPATARWVSHSPDTTSHVVWAGAACLWSCKIKAVKLKKVLIDLEKSVDGFRHECKEWKTASTRWDGRSTWSGFQLWCLENSMQTLCECIHTLYRVLSQASETQKLYLQVFFLIFLQDNPLMRLTQSLLTES